MYNYDKIVVSKEGQTKYTSNLIKHHMQHDLILKTFPFLLLA